MRDSTLVFTFPAEVKPFDHFCVVSTEQFTLFELPENKALYFGKIAIYDDFILPKGSSITVLGLSNGEMALTTVVGPVYFSHFQIIYDKLTIWQRIKQLFTGRVCKEENL